MSDIDAILGEAAMLARLGRLVEAEARLADTRSDDPRLAKGHGQILAALGKWDDALGKFSAAVAAEPTDLTSWRAIGTIRAMLRDSLGAIAAFDRILASDPDDAEALRGKADALSGAGHAARAEPLWRRLAVAGDELAALRHGICLSALGRGDEAVALYGGNAEYQVVDAEIVLSFARDSLALRAQTEAEKWYRRALVLRPESVEALTGLGSVLAATDRRSEAIDLLRRAVATDGSAIYAREVLATALLDDNQAEAARREVDALFSLDPNNAQGHAILAFAELKRIGRTGTPTSAEHADIVGRLRMAHDARPDDSSMVLPIAELINRLGLSGEAATMLKSLRRKQRGNLPVLFATARATINVCDWEDHAELRESVIENVDNAIAADAVDEESLRLLAAFGADYDQAMRVARKLAARYDRGERIETARRPRRDRLRIAYLQAQTRFHSTMAVARGLVERHDRKRFEVYGYARHDRAQDGAPDKFQEAYRGAFDVFRDLSALSDRDAARRIAEDQIDILIELNGPGAENNMGVVAFRPAPLIVHYYGHAYGTGASYIDYVLVDRIYMPPELAALGTEAPLYVPPCFMAAMPGKRSAKMLSRVALGLPEHGIVFANFNHPLKFEPKGFAVWLRMLKALPNSVLWVARWNDTAAGNLRAQVEAGGLDPKRLVVAPTAAHEDHLERLSLADIALDPFLVAGGVTTFDALRAGLPVIARRGAVNTPSARMGASIVAAAGLPELVADSDEAYEDIALNLARDTEKRLALRASIPTRSARALDLDCSARILETALQAMWRRHAAGHPPGEIEVTGIHSTPTAARLLS